MSRETVPPRCSESRGVFTRQPRWSASSIRRVVWRWDFSRIAGTRTSRLMLSLGRAVHEAERGIGVTGGADFEIERLLVRGPSGEFRCELGPQIGAYVEICDARPATQPFQNAATGKINIQLLHV